VHVRKEYLTTCNALESVSIVKYKDVHILWGVLRQINLNKVRGHLENNPEVVSLNNILLQFDTGIHIYIHISKNSHLALYNDIQPWRESNRLIGEVYNGYRIFGDRVVLC
jgi:hypothetical protein